MSVLDDLNNKIYQMQANPQQNNDFFQSDTYKTMQNLMPSYNSLRNPDGTLKSQYRLTAAPNIDFHSNLDALNQQLSGINLNTQALDQLRTEGLRAPGTMSAWGTMAYNKALSDAATSGNTALSSALSAGASRGGLTQAQRANIAAKNARNTANNTQSAGMNVGMQDEQNRQAILQQLPGMEIQALQPALQKTSMWQSMADSEAARQQALNLANRDYSTGVQKFNVGNTIGDVQGQQQFDLAKYQEIMKAYGADRTAQAQEKAGK